LLAELIKNFKLNFRRHSKYANLVLFHYDTQSNFKPESETFRIQCGSRELFLDEENSWNAEAFPFMMFFDYNSKQVKTYLHTQFDFSSSKIY
jgi:hypothetical protein